MTQEALRMDTDKTGSTALHDAWRPITRCSLSLVGEEKAWNQLTSRLQERDLKLGDASEGRMLARHLRTNDRGDQLARPLQGEQFHMLFVLAGKVNLKNKIGGAVTELGRFDCLYMPGLAPRYDIELASDTDLLELTVPSRSAVKEGLKMDLLTGQAAATPVLAADRPEAYTRKSGQGFEYFLYRDLGVADATDRRVHMQIVRATKSKPGGTGWHYHTMGQLFVVLQGSATILVEGQMARRMGPGDAMCLSAGTSHNVPDFTPDYQIWEMCIPADFDTTPVQPAEST
jgi:quercetin dioxygenase-like cupin family protein